VREWHLCDDGVITALVCSTDLQTVLAQLHQVLQEVELGLSQQLQDRLVAFGQSSRALPQVAQDAAKVLPTAVNQDPACMQN